MGEIPIHAEPIQSLVSLKLHVYNGKFSDFFSQPNRLKINHFIAILLISFIVGFRYEVGVDWAGYKDWFEFLSRHPSVSSSDVYMESGYFWVNRLVIYLGGNYALMFFVSAFISWYFIFKSVPAVLLPLTLFFLFADEYFFWSMNGVRQFVAIGIFLYSIQSIINRDLKKYLLLITLAALFHASSLLLIPLFFVPYQKLYNQKYWFMAFVVSFFFANNQLLIDSLELLVRNISGLFDVITYDRYFESGKYIALDQGLGAGYLFRVLITIFIIFFSKQVVEKYPNTKIYYILFFSGAVISNLFFNYQLVGRFNNYFLVLRSFSLAFIVYHLWDSRNFLIQGRNYHIIPICVLLLYFILFLSTIYNSSNMCSPFQFTFMI